MLPFTRFRSRNSTLNRIIRQAYRKQEVLDSLSGLVSRTGSATNMCVTTPSTTLLLGACASFAEQGAVVDGPQFPFLSWC